jgi:hypothetical protein
MVDDIRQHLRALVGKTIYTIGKKRWNRILDIQGDNVIVATEPSPRGKTVPMKEVQAAWDELRSKGELAINVKTVGYRSAFIGAVMATLPGVLVVEGEQRVRLDVGSERSQRRS